MKTPEPRRQKRNLRAWKTRPLAPTSASPNPEVKLLLFCHKLQRALLPPSFHENADPPPFQGQNNRLTVDAARKCSSVFYQEFTAGSHCPSPGWPWDPLRCRSRSPTNHIMVPVIHTPTTGCKNYDASILKAHDDIYSTLCFDLLPPWAECPRSLIRPNTILPFVLQFMPLLQRPVSSDTLLSLGLCSACLVLCLASLSLQGCQSGVNNEAALDKSRKQRRGPMLIQVVWWHVFLWRVSKVLPLSIMFWKSATLNTHFPEWTVVY